MPEWIVRLRDDITRLWGTLTQAQKWLMGGVIGALFIALIGISAAVFIIPPGEALWTDLSKADMQRIRQFLDGKGVGYRIRGNNIYVDGNTAKLRMEYSVDNSESTLGGFSFLKNGSWSDTRDQFNEKKLRALGEEIGITIKQGCEGVEWARVLLTPTNKSIFERDKTKPVASVKVGTRGRGLASEQVAGIQWLVASSMPGMKAGDVVVLDEDNQPLTGIENTSDAQRLNQEQTNLEDEKERAKIANASNFLDLVLGDPQHYAVAVEVEVNYDRKNEEETVIDTVKIFEKSLDSLTVKDENTQTGDVPGVDSNVADSSFDTGKGTGTKSESSEKSKKIENEPGFRRFTKTDIAPGEIERQWVSVAINYPLGDGEGDREEWENEVMAKYEKSLKAAVGHIEDNTAYHFDLQQYEFDTTAIVSAASEARWETIQGVVENVLFLLLGLLLMVGFFMFLKKMLTMQPVEELEEIEVELPRKPEFTLADLGIREIGDTENLSADEMKTKVIKDQVEQFAHTNAEDVADILRNWISE